MRSEEFVTRADQVIAVPGLDIDTSVRCIVNSIDEELRADLVCPLCDGGDIGQGADGIGCGGEGDEFCFFRQERLKGVEIEGRDFWVNIDDFYYRPSVSCGEDPGGEVRVVIEARDEDFVAGFPSFRESAREGEG